MLKRNWSHRTPSMFSEELLFDIYQVWGVIGADVLEYSDADDNESLIESCVDANRLSAFGSKESEDEFMELCKTHGYRNVLTQLNSIVRLGA